MSTMKARPDQRLSDDISLLYAFLTNFHLLFFTFSLNMVSAQVIPVLGLNITVYGLEEYKQLPKGSPVAVMFALHGRLRKPIFPPNIADAVFIFFINKKQFHI